MYDERFLDFAVESIREYPRHAFDQPIMITGEPRTGKTNLGIKLAGAVDKHFAVDQIAFRLDEMAAVIRRNPKVDPENGIYPQAFGDESGFSLFSQRWMEEAQVQFIKELEVIGILCNLYWFVAPNRDDINKKVRDERTRFWFYTTHYKLKRGIAEFWESTPSRWGTRFWWPKCVFMFDKVEPSFWTTYTARKIDFVRSVLEAGPEDTNQKSKSKAAQEQRDKAIRLLKSTTTMTQEDIADALGLHKSTISRVLTHA